MAEILISVIKLLFVIALIYSALQYIRFANAQKGVKYFKENNLDKITGPEQIHQIEIITKGLLRELMTELAGETKFSKDLNSLLAHQAGKLDSLLKFPRMISSLLVLIGLLGTVSGVLISMQGVSLGSQSNVSIVEMRQSISLIFNGLDTAFLTTFYGILGTVILTAINFGVAAKGNSFWYSYRSFAKRVAENIRDEEGLDFHKSASIAKNLAETKSLFESLKNMEDSIDERLLQNIDQINRDYKKWLRQFTGYQNELTDGFKRQIGQINFMRQSLYELSIELNDVRSNLNSSVSQIVANEKETLKEFSEHINGLIKSIERLPKELNLGRLLKELTQTRYEKAIVTVATPKYFSKRKWTRLLISCHTHSHKAKARSRFKTRENIEIIESKESESNLWHRYVGVKITPAGVFEMDARSKIYLRPPITEFTISLKPSDEAQIREPIPASIILIDADSNEELIEIPIDLQVKDYVVDHVSRPLVHHMLTGGAFVAGTLVITLENITQYGFKTFFGLPPGELLISMGAFVQLLNFWKYGKRTKSFELAE